MNIYESIFILKPSISDEDVQKVVSKMEGIVKQGAELTATENWGKKKLAYEVAKEKRGVYVLLRFQGKGDIISELERNYRIDDNVIKFLTVKLNKKEIEQLKKKEAATAAATAASHDKVAREKEEGSTV
ncbi:MAG TPA: 30S ribosomal protein S6 [Nitrospirota bacterium]|nr:30S ribosomal protein S6 [Nitrospirota bacterium]